jgi:hypothetical protein
MKQKEGPTFLDWTWGIWEKHPVADGHESSFLQAFSSISESPFFHLFIQPIDLSTLS